MLAVRSLDTSIKTQFTGAEAQKTVAENKDQSFSFHGEVGQVNTGDVTVHGNQIGIHNQQHQQSLNEAFQEIQQLWEAFAKQYGVEDEEKFAENLAEKAKQDKTFHQKLSGWSQSLLGLSAREAAKVSGGELAKKIVPKALTLLATLI